jgi:hypothetical protein
MPAAPTLRCEVLFNEMYLDSTFGYVRSHVGVIGQYWDMNSLKLHLPQGDAISPRRNPDIGKAHSLHTEKIPLRLRDKKSDKIIRASIKIEKNYFNRLTKRNCRAD